ncbi:MAG: hypothetical protein KJ718_03930 [Nanoarchaeota archaeon]|nr:hypothetical protein [Nanoarchaeota archaeon]MBU1051677.1 hypothetical protein [Nanoarchaeota archaeon]
MEIRKNDDKYFEWEKRVFALDLADAKLERKFKNNEIKKKEKNKIKKYLNKLWINVWDYYPDKNQSVEEAFKLNFGQ